MVRSFANPSSLSTQRSESSLFLDLEAVLGAICLASDTVTIFSKRSWGLPSAVHNSLALFSYITCNHNKTKQHSYSTLPPAGERNIEDNKNAYDYPPHNSLWQPKSHILRNFSTFQLQGWDFQSSELVPLGYFGCTYRILFFGIPSHKSTSFCYTRHIYKYEGIYSKKHGFQRYLWKLGIISQSRKTSRPEICTIPEETGQVAGI